MVPLILFGFLKLQQSRLSSANAISAAWPISLCVSFKTSLFLSNLSLKFFVAWCTLNAPWQKLMLSHRFHLSISICLIESEISVLAVYIEWKDHGLHKQTEKYGALYFYPTFVGCLLLLLHLFSFSKWNNSMLDLVKVLKGKLLVP